MPFVITQSCCSDAGCVSVCPVNCIHPTPEEKAAGGMDSEILHIDPNSCIDCGACADACPESCISFVDNGSEEELRTRLRAPARNLGQSLYVSPPLGTGRVMVKDENLCLHCGVCSERCPTSVWEMQKFLYHSAQAGQV